MKFCFLLLIVALGLLSCQPNDKKFTVRGSIKNGPDKTLLLEEIPVATMERVIVDSVRLGKDGSFAFKAEKKESCLYDLRFEESMMPVAWLVNDGARLKVDAVIEQGKEENYKVEGSEASLKMKNFLVEFKSTLAQYIELLKQMSVPLVPDSALTRLNNERISTGNALKVKTLRAIRESKNPALGMFVLGYYQTTANNRDLQIPGIGREEVSAIVNGIYTEFPSHQGVAMVKRSLDEQLQQLMGMIGQMAPEIRLKDVNGNELSSNSFRGKYLLIDFWASWCPPCRAENPNIVNLWQKYKAKNFEILGVSLDKPGEKNEWIKAIKDDGLTWNHVSDLQYWDSPVVPLYQIESLPFNVLVDPSGKIIGQKLLGASLEMKLAEVLK